MMIEALSVPPSNDGVPLRGTPEWDAIMLSYQEARWHQARLLDAYLAELLPWPKMREPRPTKSQWREFIRREKRNAALYEPVKTAEAYAEGLLGLLSAAVSSRGHWTTRLSRRIQSPPPALLAARDGSAYYFCDLVDPYAGKD